MAKWKLTLHSQVSRALGISSREGDLSGLRHSAVVQDQSVFGTVLHNLNVLQTANKLQHFSKNGDSKKGDDGCGHFSAHTLHFYLKIYTCQTIEQKDEVNVKHM